MNTNELNLIPLPKKVEEICREIDAPPRLVAHLTLVHDVAVKLIERITYKYPSVSFNEQNVKSGAATHDLGKAVYPSELISSGNQHENIGEDLLKRFNVPSELARFTRTHASWKTEAASNLEDLLVALADTC